MRLKEKIKKSVHILELAAEYEIKLEEISSGDFTHRCRCPNKDHKHGVERTASLYISESCNSFYCFGCGAGSNVLDFYMICEDVDYVTALKELKPRVPDNFNTSSFYVKPENYDLLLEISDIIKKAIYNNEEQQEYIIRFAEQVDYKMEKINKHDISSTLKLLQSVKNFLTSKELL